LAQHRYDTAPSQSPAQHTGTDTGSTQRPHPAQHRKMKERSENIVLVHAGGDDVAPKVRPDTPPRLQAREKMSEDCAGARRWGCGAKGSSWIPSPVSITSEREDE
jgi:hypothetical protein